MIKFLFTRLRNLFAPQFMRNIDQYLLTHNALVWETRVHWFTLYATALLLLLVGVGFCVPISFPDGLILFKTIENGLIMVQLSVIGIIGLFFLLLVNGLFARFFKTGFIAINQKFRPIDFFKLAGIYGFMLVFAAIACSAYHYTLIVRTHFIINEKQNYALLDKYAKIYEFYQQDTLRVKGFETIKPYINANDLEYSTIEFSHIYQKIPTVYDTTFTDPRIKAYYYNNIRFVSVNQALYRLLPKESDFQKLRKNSFDLVKVLKPDNSQLSDYEYIESLSEDEITALTANSVVEGMNPDYNLVTIYLSKNNDIIKNIDNKTCGYTLNELAQNLEQYCRFTHYSIPHTNVYNSDKNVVLDKDTVSISIVEKNIDKTFYANHNNYWRFFAKQALAILFVAVFFVVLLLSFHAYQSFRFFTLIPAAVPFTAIMVEEFFARHGDKDVIVISMAIFYILFALFTVFWHRKIYTTNPLKLAIIYSILAMLCSIPLLQIAPYLVLNEDVLSATQIANAHNIIVPILFFTHILLYIFLFFSRNTRFSVITPFLYFLAFIWLFMPDILGLYHMRIKS